MEKTLKNIELQNESFDRLTKIMQEIVSNTLDISTLIQPLQNLKETINPFKSLISNTPNIVLPEIELPKYNIPNYFELKEKNTQFDKSNKE